MTNTSLSGILPSGIPCTGKSARFRKSARKRAAILKLQETQPSIGLIAGSPQSDLTGPPFAKELASDYSSITLRYMEFFGLEKTRSTMGTKNSSGSLS